MLIDLLHDSESTILSSPTLCIPLISGLSTPANSAPDTSVTNGICIHMHLTSFTGINSEQLSTISVLPIMTDKGLSYGGTSIAHGPKVLPKYTLEGFMDTPCSQVGEYFISQIVDSAGITYTYGELLAALLEGRLNVQTSGQWERLDPLWFRDPYGRVFNTPRILDFSGTYVEGIPERNQFTMTLKV